MMAVLSLAACKKETNPASDGEKKEFTISASVDGGLGNEWKSGDEIKVVVNDELYTFTTNQAGTSSEFTEEEGLLTAEIIGENAVTAYHDCANMYGTFRIQAEQEYGNGASSADIPMYAYTMNAPENNRLAMVFKPLASVLRLVMEPYPMSVEKIEIAPAADATVSTGAMAGGYTVNAESGSVSVTNAINAVTVTFPAALNIAQGATVDIPVGWFGVEGGLQITFTYDGTKEYVSTVWTEGLVKSYNENGGMKSARLITETIEFDANAFPRSYYVTTTASADSKGLSWSAPTTLSSALENAVSGSVIHIAAGTYHPETHIGYLDADAVLPAQDEFKSFSVLKNVSLIGGYPASPSEGAVADASLNKTILDGNDKSYHTLVVAAPVVAGEKVVLEGITVTGGLNTADQEGLSSVFGEEDMQVSVAGNYAAGVAVIGTAVEMKNVVITENNGHSGVGLYCYKSDIKMTGCTVSKNTSIANGAGAWFTTGTELLMDGCVIDGNTCQGIAGGMYLYVPAEASMEAEIKNTTISGNKAVKADGSYYNQAGLYVRDDSGSHLLESSFTSCIFDGNIGNMGASFSVLNAKTSFTSCVFRNNSAPSGNGQMYVNTSNGMDAEVVFDKCQVYDNYAKGLGSGIYAYNNGGKLDLYVFDSAFYNNDTDGRGGALYARNNVAGDVNVKCVNTTFAGNKAKSWGGAINLYGAAAKKTYVDLISCTVTGNHAKNASYPGGVTLETAGTTLNTYNCIIAGNTVEGQDGYTDVKIKDGITANVSHKATFAGSAYYNASGSEAAVSPAFDVDTMLGDLVEAEGTRVCKLLGNENTNPAFGNGMTASELEALASGELSAAVLAADQTGAPRTGKITGACVLK